MTDAVQPDVPEQEGLTEPELPQLDIEGARLLANEARDRLHADGLTTGCGQDPLRYCPEQQLLRSEMAVFLLRLKHGAAYDPPTGTGTVFADVPASYWAVDWIEQLLAEGITTGCAPGVYCPDQPLPRSQMAVFLKRTLGLTLGE